MVFKKLQKRWTQPEPLQCVPTAIKTVLTNQFPHLKVPSLKDIGKMCQYRQIYGVSIERLELNMKKLEKIGIKFHLKEESNINQLKELLENNKYPLVLFHLKDYNSWKDYSIEVETDDEISFHMVIVVGVNPQKKEVKVFDTLYHKYKNYKSSEIYDKINFQKFYKLWTTEELIYPVFWFSEIPKIPKKGEKEQKRVNKWMKKN